MPVGKGPCKDDVYDGLLRDAQWVNIARELGVALQERKWNMARTRVFSAIEEDINFCKAYAKSLILCDDCGIGKTYSARYLSRTLKNCFYIDCRQSSSKNELVRALAKAIGVEHTGNLHTVRSNIKYALRLLPHPCVIIDEAGALEDRAVMLLIELWNATEQACGWYMMGADGLRAKMERNISNKKTGWAELFSRYNERYTSIVPAPRADRMAFYKKLIADVLGANMPDTTRINQVVNKCLVNDSGRISGLRRAETLVLLES